jgi:hypothetical protein
MILIQVNLSSSKNKKNCRQFNLTAMDDIFSPAYSMVTLYPSVRRFSATLCAYS